MEKLLPCPRCRNAMAPLRVTAAHGPVVVDVCTHGCGGVWLDAGDQRAGLDISDDLPEVLPDTSSLTAADCSQAVACPICEQQMIRFRWNYNSPVLLDECNSGCGTWIDGGEAVEMEVWETQQLLTEPKRAHILARVSVARLEGETAILAQANEGRHNPMVHLLSMLMRRLDGL